MLERAAEQGFDTILCHGAVPAGFAASRTQGRAGDADGSRRDACGGQTRRMSLFVALPLPTLDPRRDTELSSRRYAMVTGPDSAAALAQFWARQVTQDPDIAGVRLLGLRDLSAALLPPFLAEVRRAAPDLLLFGWTPGLPWETLAALERLARSTMSRFRCRGGTASATGYGASASLLQPIGTVIADAGEHALSRAPPPCRDRRRWLDDQ